jgi:hypothetical protein
MATDIDQVKKYVALFLNAAKWIEAIVPGTADDKVIEAISNLVTQPWFAEFAVFVLKQFENGKTPSMGEFGFAISQFVPDQNDAPQS